MTASARTSATSASTGSRRRDVTKEHYEPRPEFADIAAIEGGWLSDGQVPAADVARVWVSPERARWAREEHTVVEELADGAIVIEVPYGSPDWLLREILKGAGDFVVLEPEEAREAVRAELETDTAAQPATAKAALARRSAAATVPAWRTSDSASAA